jgi:hypothetical protein
LTPAQRDPTDIRTFLKSLVALMRRNGAAVAACRRSSAGWLLEHGRHWTPPASRGVARPGSPKQCYRNAAMLALAESCLVYCEGFAVAHFPVEHAWCVDRVGRVVEPTWHCPGSEYFGVPIRTAYLRKALVDQGSCGVLGSWGKPSRIYRARVGAWRQLGM